MEVIKILGTIPLGNTVYQDIAIDICEGCSLAAFMLAALGVWMQAKEVKDDDRKRVHEVLLTRGLSALIVGNVALAVVFMLSTLKWTTA